MLVTVVVMLSVIIGIVVQVIAGQGWNFCHEHGLQIFSGQREAISSGVSSWKDLALSFVSERMPRPANGFGTQAMSAALPLRPGAKASSVSPRLFARRCRGA